MRRITKAALGGLAGSALMLGGIQAASGDVIKKIIEVSPSVDLDKGTTALDQPDTKATLRIIPAPDGAATSFKLQVTGIDAPVGSVFGAHLHVGKCVEPTLLVPNPVGPHYKANDKPASPENEVWFDLVVNDQGEATDDTKVLFRPTDVDGDMSVVIHVDVAAVSSTKQACLPLRVEDLNPPAEVQ